VPTHEYWEGVAPSSAAMVGRAVEMICSSKPCGGDDGT
jgi:hypothetical protein